MEIRGQSHNPCALLQWKKPDIHSMGGWVGPKVDLDYFREEKYFLQLSNPGSTSPYLRNPINLFINM